MSATKVSKSPELSDKAAATMARALARHHWEKKVEEVQACGGGLTNFVFEARTTAGTFIIRIGRDPGKIKDYLKEQWAIAEVKAAGVPVPEVLEVGAEVIRAPYMISKKVEGIEGTLYPDILATTEALGRLTALVHSVPTSGFGHTFDWSNNKLSRKETWADYLKRELKLDERLNTLGKHKMLSPGQGKRLKATLRDIEGWDDAPALNHGDMRLKNVIVDEKSGAIKAVLDWEFCCSNIAPYWDLSLALHDLSVDAKQAFIKGYGLDRKTILDMAPVLKALNIINYAPYVAEAAERADKDLLDQYRVRFSGALDLYSV